MEPFGSDRPSSNFRDQLSNRLLDARTIVLNDELTRSTAGQITEQLAVLDAESAEPIQFIMSGAPGGEVDAGLSVYDLLRSISAPVTMLAGGRITGAGVIAFVGAASERRYALPHVRFRLEAPRERTDEGPAADLAEKAEAAQDRRKRVVYILTNATGRPPEQIEEDLTRGRAFDAQEAADYGLITRVVQNRREIE
jgi:ATP-dependent Clp protease protease subunit